METARSGDPVSSWPPLRAGTDGLEDAWLQIYSALQWLARVENSYVDPALGAQKLQLHWDPDRCAVLTGEFEGNTSLEMRLPAFLLQFKENGTPTRYAFNPDDKSPAEIEAWILVELLHRKIDRSRFSKNLPYGVSHLLTGDAPHFRVEGREQEFEDVADWLRAADDILRRAGEEARARGWEAASPVRFRPGDFVLFTRVGGAADSASAGELEIGFGTRGDRKLPAFYVCSEGAPEEVLELPIERVVEEGLDRDAVLAAFDLEKRLSTLSA